MQQQETSKQQQQQTFRILNEQQQQQSRDSKKNTLANTTTTTTSNGINSSSSRASSAPFDKKKKNQNRYHHCYAFVQECQHRGKDYYCCPSYSSPGGIRSLLFQNRVHLVSSSSGHTGEGGESSINKNSGGGDSRSSCCSTTRLLGRNESHHDPLKSFTFHFLSHPLLSSDLHFKENWDVLGNSDCYKLSLQSSAALSTVSLLSSSSSNTTSATTTTTTTALDDINSCTGCYFCKLTLEPFVIQSAIDLVEHYIQEQSDSCPRNSNTTTTTTTTSTTTSTPRHTIIMSSDHPQHQHSHITSLLSFLAFDSNHDSQHDSLQSLHKHTIPVVVESKEKQRMHTGECTLEKATIVYHESARSIVFRDHLRRVHVAQEEKTTSGGQLKKHCNNHTNDDNIKNSRSRSKSNASHMSDATCTTCASTVKSKRVENDDPLLKSVQDKNERLLDSLDPNTVVTHVSHVKSHSVPTQSVASIASTFDESHQDNHYKNNRHSRSSVNHQEDHQSISTMEIDNDHDTIPPRTQPARSTLRTRPQVIIANFTPEIDPLPPLDLESHNDFSNLFSSNPYEWRVGQGPEEASPNKEVWNSMSRAEQEVVGMLLHQKCCVKTIKNSELSSFLQKFPVKKGAKARRWLHPFDFQHASKVERINKYTECDDEYNSFYTSLSLLPPLGLKMRCYGSTREYTTGVIFALPRLFSSQENEDMAARRTHSWAWPSGYAAKTEFNISPSGELINGREEALVSISQLRTNNHSYVYDRDYEVLGKIIKGGFHVLPYNEVFCRVGGIGRIVNGIGDEQSFDYGLGLPVALFCRTATYGDLTSLLRLRARFGAVLGKESVRSMPLLLIDPDLGTRVLTEKLQQQLLSTMANSLNPFQNPYLRHKTAMGSMSEDHFHQKLQELLDLDDDNIRHVLTTEECARLAGGFGATDESVAHLLMDAMLEDHETQEHIDEPHLTNEENQNKLQSIVNEGLCAAVRSGDFNTSRQLLILYTLVASRCKQGGTTNSNPSCHHNFQDDTGLLSSSPTTNSTKPKCRRLARQISSMSVHNEMNTQVLDRKPSSIPSPPPPPPLDTDRLRSATNSDGLLAVLGAAEVLKSLQTGAASKRALEAAASIDEWIEKSEHSVAFRLASWRDLTAAQDDLKIATENNSSFMAFVSNKAISNRRRFSQQLRHAIAHTNFEGIEFLKEIHAILKTMHSPCLRLELLQFILGLDNRYSVAHVARSIELAATCLNISASDDIFANDEVDGDCW